MDELLDTKHEFSLLKRAKSFAHAGRGIFVLLKTTPNVWIHLVAVIVVVALGFYFHITTTEWIVLVFVCGFVLVSEAFNTAIEIDMNLTSPEQHPYARDTKDVAAGAVLISAITALIIGVIIFIQYVV
jgi:diacylglycerol kinase (ATP)